MAGRITLGIISHQPVAASMAGPGIRCWELSRALAPDADVTLFSPAGAPEAAAPDLKPAGFKLVAYDDAGLAAATAGCEVILCQGFILNNHPELRQPGRIFIIDLYVPMTLEALPQYEDKPVAEQNAVQAHIARAILEQMKAGHFFICASERQRDYWLGWLSAAGRLTAEAYGESGDLSHLIGIVPFGLPDEPPLADAPVLKGVHPAIGENDKVALWGGGIYNWLDPFTPIRAMAELSGRRPDIKLFFLGARHPDPGVPKMRVYDEAVALSRELGLLDRTVIFNDRWVRYEDRVNYLLEADIGVSANLPHVETRFSFRTRILDCIWASLPVAATDGDFLSELVERRGLGLVVPSGDPAALAAAIEKLVDDKELRARSVAGLQEVAEEYRWKNAAGGVRDFLARVGSTSLRDRAVISRLGLAGGGYEGCEASPGGLCARARRMFKSCPAILSLGRRVKRIGQRAASGGSGGKPDARPGPAEGNAAGAATPDRTAAGSLVDPYMRDSTPNRLARELHRLHFFDATRRAGKSAQVLFTEGPQALVELMRLRRSDPLQYQYNRWMRLHPLSQSDLASMRQAATGFAYQPLISILMPVYNVDSRWLAKAIDSVKAQVYENWELCIADDASTRPGLAEQLDAAARAASRIKVSHLEKNQGISGASNAALAMATGEFIGLLDNDDELSPDALFEVVKLLNEHPGTDMIYSDEDKLDAAGRRCEPFFKPDWSPDLFFATMYTCHFGVYRRTIADKIGGFRKGFEGSQDYDFVLRFIEAAGEVRHIARVLYHWRKIPGSTAESYDVKGSDGPSQKALAEAVARTGGGAVEKGINPGFFRVRRPVAGDPLVSIIIPTRDQPEMLQRCVGSIREKTGYPAYEIIIVDNDSRQPATRRYLDSLVKDGAARVVSYHGRFNFSAINNMAAREAAGEYLLFLNNDTEVAEPGWLTAMMEFAVRENTGAVGARLVYPSGAVQHAGIVLGLGGVANHAFYLFPPERPSYFNLLDSVRNVSAVTGACLLTRRSLFLEMKGFDEVNCPVAFNDVDYCLRLRQAGYLVVYTPHARLIHHEMVSRGLQKPPESGFMLRRWPEVIQQDPYYNPNLSRIHFDYSLEITR